MNPSILKKIRCRFIDKSSGKPLKGVIASLSVIIGDGSNLVNLPITTLSSDASGYLSFDLKPIIQTGMPVTTCLLSAPKYGLENYDLFASIKKKNTENDGQTQPPEMEERKRVEAKEMYRKLVGAFETNQIGRKKKPLCIVFPVYLETRKIKSEDCGCTDGLQQTLPSIQNPDTCDYEVSPFSFVKPSAIKTGSDSCESIAPSSLPLQQYHFSKIIIRDDSAGNSGSTVTNQQSNVPSALSTTVNIVNVNTPLATTTPIIKFGEILDYKQCWHSLGHSLGEIKYSLPLAPGESTQLAVIEWSRQDTAGRADSVTATEFLDHDSRRDRSIEDTVSAALNEKQAGDSFMAGTSGAASVPLEYVSLSFNHAIGGSVSHSSGSRNVEGDSLQDLHDRVRQASASVRSLNSTVIVQSSQAENNTVQTRRVANHNHCHAMTIQYYEVLRHYKLSTEYKGKRRAVLIPFSTFLFTEDIALRFRQPIERMLLDPSLKDGFDAMLRKKMPELYPTRSNTITVNGDNSNSTPTGVTVKRGDRITINASGLIDFNYNNSVSKHGPDGSSDVAGSNCPGVGLKQYSLCFKIGNGLWQQGGESLSTIADSDGEIYLISNDSYYGDNGGSWTVNVMATNAGAIQQGLANTNNSAVVSVGKPTTKTEDKITPKDPFKVDGKRRGDIYKRTEYGKQSGIYVKKGEKISIQATGRINVGDGYNLGYTADGHDTLLGGASAVAGTAQSLKWYSLMFRIGFDNDWQQGGTSVNSEASNDGELIFMINDGNYLDNTGEFEVTVSITSKITVEVPAEAEQSHVQNPTVTSNIATTVSPAIKDKLSTLSLITHLNNNQGYYNRIVWMMMDGVERRLYLEAALSGNQEMLNVIDDMPVAVTGNYLAFPCGLSIDADSNNTQPGELVEDIVCFPTRGLFAEAQLGHCNSCEERDITRMWDWNEMTTETPPDISGISPGPKGTPVNLTPAQLPSNVIQITQPQNAPDPTGLANALTLLGNGNAFRDMSGLNQVSTLLGELARLSSEANVKALAITGQKQIESMKKEEEKKKGSGVGGGSGSAGSTGNNGNRTQPNETNAASQVDKIKALTQAVEDGILSYEDAQNAAKGIFGGEEVIESRPIASTGDGIPIGAFDQLTISEAKRLGKILPMKKLPPTNWESEWFTSPEKAFMVQPTVFRKDYYEKYLGPYLNQINESAKKFNIPRLVLSSIILAEMIDVKEDDRVQERIPGIRGSFGFAQLDVFRAQKYNLFPDITDDEKDSAVKHYLKRYQIVISPDSTYMEFLTSPVGALLNDELESKKLELAIKNRIQTPQYSIDGAAQLIRIYLDDLAVKRTNAWAKSCLFIWDGSPLPNPDDIYLYCSTVNTIALCVGAAYNSPEILDVVSAEELKSHKNKFDGVDNGMTQGSYAEEIHNDLYYNINTIFRKN